MKYFIHIFIITVYSLSFQICATEIITDIKPAHTLIEDIKSGGHIIYMRHGITKRKDNNRNKVLIDLSKCETQRNLTDEGRQQVKGIGKVIKSLAIPIGKVKSSPYCRTKDTAQATFGQYDIDEKLAFSISKAHEESQKLGLYLKNEMLKSYDATNNTVFVGHTANLKDGLGVWPKPEGVVVIFKKQQNNIVYKGMIKPSDWLSLK